MSVIDEPTIVANFTSTSLDDELIMKAIRSPSFNQDNIDTVILNNSTLLKYGNYGEQILDPLREKGVKPVLNADIGLCENGSMKAIDTPDLAAKFNAYEIDGGFWQSKVYNLINEPMIIAQQLSYASFANNAGLLQFVFTEFSSDVEDRGSLEFKFNQYMTSYVTNGDALKGLKMFLIFNPTIDDNVLSNLSLHDPIKRVFFTEGNMSRINACRKISRSWKTDACFGPALLEDLDLDMTDRIFDLGLQNSITEIRESVDKNRTM